MVLSDLLNKLNCRVHIFAVSEESKSNIDEFISSMPQKFIPNELDELTSSTDVGYLTYKEMQPFLNREVLVVYLGIYFEKGEPEEPEVRVILDAD